MKRLFFYLAMIFLFCHCNRETTPRVSILVATDDTLTDRTFGDSILFHVRSSAVNDVVKNVTVTGNDLQRGTVLVLDTLLNREVSEFDFYYVVSQRDIPANIELTFTAFLQSNVSTASYKTLVQVVADTQSVSHAIVHHEHLTMFGCGQTFDGFNLETLSNVVGITNADIYDTCDPLDTNRLLSKIWRSHTGVYFVRFNDFDYLAATSTSIQSVYDSSLKSDSLFDVEEGDIIIVGKNNQVLGAIRIKLIYNFENGIDNRYVFDYKRIQR
ncbi:MAG: hypothetical protein LBH82_00910 [Bacteroidales bacterium]|jgi:hypothetical protein|nr:hypothetical protein [Bacteroidales bacterium]